MEDLHVLNYIDSIHNKLFCKNHYVFHDPLEDLPDYQFKKKYRMSKEAFLKLLSMTEKSIRESTETRGRPTSASRQLLITLRFYAVGTFHDVTGEMIGHSRSHVSVIITRVSRILSSLLKDFIKLPADDEAKRVSYSDYLPAE